MSHEKGIEAACRAINELQGSFDSDELMHSPYQSSWEKPDSFMWRQWQETAEEAIKAYLDASGMVMVPKRVSREMDAAGYDACPWNILDPSKKDHQEVYYAMIGAARNPFQTPEESREKK